VVAVVQRIALAIPAAGVRKLARAKKTCQAAPPGNGPAAPPGNPRRAAGRGRATTSSPSETVGLDTTPERAVFVDLTSGVDGVTH
jgi:hypothetical protein